MLYDCYELSAWHFKKKRNINIIVNVKLIYLKKLNRKFAFLVFKIEEMFIHF